MDEIFLYNHNFKKDSELNVWLAFPGIYSFGMASLGFLSVFKRLDEKDYIFAERIFTDTKNTHLRPSDVDVLGFSMSFELDFLSIFKILENYKIPFLAKDRDETFPLIYGGGPVLSSNPEPFAMFFDFIMVGDAETTQDKIFEIIKDNKNNPKVEILKAIAEVEGVYVPLFTKYDLNKLLVTDIDGNPYKVKKVTSELKECIYTPILSEKSYFSNTFVIEIARGCPQRCGFCQASYLNLPARYCDYDQIIDLIEEGLKHTNKIAFLGALICAHPRFDDICDYIIKKVDSGVNIELSVSSLRADYISAKTIEMLVKCGQKHATIAIEAGSERLRKAINKNLSEEQIIEVAKIAKENGLHGLKIYGMIGLPTETQEDLDEMIRLTKKLKSLYKGFDLTFSFATFVPKAHAPFQYSQRENTKSLEKKYEYLKKEFHKMGVKIRCSSVKWDYIQAIFSRGDRRLAQYLIDVYNSGANIGCFKNTYKQYYKEKLLPKSEYFALESINVDRNLPWGFIDVHGDCAILKSEFKRLLK